MVEIYSNFECDSVLFFNFYLMKGNMHATTHMWQAEKSLGGVGSLSTIRLPGIELQSSGLRQTPSSAEQSVSPDSHFN